MSGVAIKRGASIRRRRVGPARAEEPAVEPLPRRVYRMLSDRQFHSGQLLAQRCGVSRSAIWKAMATLRLLGVEVHAVANRGYRLPMANALLESDRIVQLLPAALAAQLRHAETSWSCTSTNSELLGRAAPPPGQFDFLTAEHQTAGRGRRTRSWWAPPGGAICLSLSWCFTALPANVGSLSLAIGVCVLRALATLGKLPVALKWPNDLVAESGKLGGILTELRAEADGPALIVIGIGLNVALGVQLTQQLTTSGAHGTDLTALGIADCDRSQLAAALIAECVGGLLQFERSGFSAFVAEWRAADVLTGKAVVVSSADGATAGHARGIDISGALCVQTRDGLQRFASADVSVRPT